MDVFTKSLFFPPSLPQSNQTRRSISPFRSQPSNIYRASLTYTPTVLAVAQTHFGLIVHAFVSSPQLPPHPPNTTDVKVFPLLWASDWPTWPSAQRWSGTMATLTQHLHTQCTRFSQSLPKTSFHLPRAVEPFKSGPRKHHFYF